MKKNFKELRDEMSQEHRDRADVRAQEMMAEMLLAEIRKQTGLTQEELAKTLGIKQPSLSKLESQSDMQISTLQRLIEALGGKLELIAHLPKGDVRLTQFIIKGRISVCSDPLMDPLKAQSSPSQSLQNLNNGL